MVPNWYFYCKYSGVRRELPPCSSKVRDSWFTSRKVTKGWKQETQELKGKYISMVKGRYIRWREGTSVWWEVVRWAKEGGEAGSIKRDQRMLWRKVSHRDLAKWWNKNIGCWEWKVAGQLKGPVVSSSIKFWESMEPVVENQQDGGGLHIFISNLFAFFFVLNKIQSINLGWKVSLYSLPWFSY